MGGEAGGIAKPFFWDGWENPKALKGGYLRRWIFWSDQNYPGIKREEFIRSGPSFPCLQCVPKLSACSARRPGFISSPLLGALASPKKKALKFFFLAPTPKKKTWLFTFISFIGPVLGSPKWSSFSQFRHPHRGHPKLLIVPSCPVVVGSSLISSGPSPVSSPPKKACSATNVPQIFSKVPRSRGSLLSPAS